jgi:hypothetical protein
MMCFKMSRNVTHFKMCGDNAQGAFKWGSVGLLNETSALILMSLTETITGNRKVKINYANYETSVVEAHSVKLVGWPQDINFVNPSGIGTVGEIRRLRDALKSGDCH